MSYRPISEYPRCDCCTEGWKWGPDVIVWLVEGGFRYPFVAHLEAGEWMAYAPDDPAAVTSLPSEPEFWSPLPDGPPQMIAAARNGHEEVKAHRNRGNEQKGGTPDVR